MEVSGITNLNQYAIMLAKQAKIEIFKQKTTDSNFLSGFATQNAETQKAKRIQDIKGKLKMGQKLSHGDMEYLRNNDPALYEKAMKIKKERENYRRDLKKCKTKREAIMVNLGKLMQFKMEEKREDPEILMMRMAAILNEHIDFVKSEDYKDLPEDEKEKREEEEEEEEEEAEGAEAEEGYESDEKKNKTNDVELESNAKFKNKKAKKIRMPEIKIELPQAYSVKQESLNIFTSLRA